MPTHTVDLSDQQVEFINASVGQGGFKDAGDVIRAALRLLQSQDEMHRAKLQRLREAVQVGMDCFDRGEYETITADTLDAFMDSIRADVQARVAER